jgi:twinkle protein
MSNVVHRGGRNVGDVTGREQCPDCASKGGDTSEDNLARYADGGAHCHACGYHEFGDESDRPERVTHQKATSGLVDSEPMSLVKRGITEDTCKKFGYGIGTFRGVKVQVANYRDKNGRVVAQKLRDAKKKFVITGDAKSMRLYGEWLWPEGGKMIVVTEGEIDALSVSQLQQNKWPVVSVPNGAQSAARAVANSIEYLETFEKVIFMFDMDEPGRAASVECAQMMSPGKAHVATLPLKDANECMLGGKGKDVISAIWNAKLYRPDGIIDAADVVDKACADIEIGRPWPWPALTERTYGRRHGELYGFGGGTGTGKSTIFKQLVTHILDNEDVPVGLLMLEETPAMTAKTIAGMRMGKRVHVPGVEYDTEELREALSALGGRVYLYDHFGSMSFEVIREKIRYMVRSLGVRDIFLDHLTALAASIDTDERKAIDAIMAELSSLTQELNCTIYYVSHLATPEGKAHEEGGRVLEKQFRGSRAIAYWSHFLFGIERDKQDETGVTTFRVLKDRFTGDSAGLRFGLSYDTETGLLHQVALPDADDANPFNADVGEY